MVEHDSDDPRLGVKRWGDTCFHAVEEVVPEGYIVDGILIAREDVREVIHLDDEGNVCDSPRSDPRSTQPDGED